MRMVTKVEFATVVVALAVCPLVAVATVVEGDECALPLASITDDAFYDMGSNAAAIGEPNEPPTACGLNGNQTSLWFELVPERDGEVCANTFGSTFDTILEALTGTCTVEPTFDLTSIACNDDFGNLQSRITFPVSEGVPVRIRLTGFNGSSGDFQFRLAYADVDSDGDGIADCDEASSGRLKLVGDPADPCGGASDVMVVEPGTEVGYCYEMANTTGITVTAHSLVDDVLGTLLDGSETGVCLDSAGDPERITTFCTEANKDSVCPDGASSTCDTDYFVVPPGGVISYTTTSVITDTCVRNTVAWDPQVRICCDDDGAVSCENNFLATKRVVCSNDDQCTNGDFPSCLAEAGACCDPNDPADCAPPGTNQRIVCFEDADCTSFPYTACIKPELLTTVRTATARVTTVDADGDGVGDACDNCVDVGNASQANADGDANGNACDEDDDNDLIADFEDNCPLVANPDQANVDRDALGDACDSDSDNDGVDDVDDNCDFVANADQGDTDGDGIGDACEQRAPVASAAGLGLLVLALAALALVGLRRSATTPV